MVLACRSIDRGNNLRKNILKELDKDRIHQPRIDVMLLDLSSLESIRKFGEEWNEKGIPLDVLVCNAGIFAMSDGRSETIDGIESHIATNYLGHFLLTILLLPSMEKASNLCGKASRVVCVSSRLHLLGNLVKEDPELKAPGAYSSLAAYAQSKLAQVIFARELNRLLKGKIRAVALHPGEVLTDVVRTLPHFLQRMYKMIMAAFLLSPEQGKLDIQCLFKRANCIQIMSDYLSE